MQEVEKQDDDVLYIRGSIYRLLLVVVFVLVAGFGTFVRTSELRGVAVRSTGNSAYMNLSQR